MSNSGRMIVLVKGNIIIFVTYVDKEAGMTWVGSGVARVSGRVDKGRGSQ